MIVKKFIPELVPVDAHALECIKNWKQALNRLPSSVSQQLSNHFMVVDYSDKAMEDWIETRHPKNTKFHFILRVYHLALKAMVEAMNLRVEITDSHFEGTPGFIFLEKEGK